jgi:hypothetical protein
VRQIADPDLEYHSELNVYTSSEKWSTNRITKPVFTIVKKDIFVAAAYISSLICQDFSRTTILSKPNLPAPLKIVILRGMRMRTIPCELQLSHQP